MAKYKCIEGNGCIYNNYGWCQILNKNGLKKVKECNHFNDGKKETDNSLKKEKLNLEIGRVMGKREMLFYLQKACLAKKQPLTLEDISAYSKTLEYEEALWKVEDFEDTIQRDIRKTSKSISQEQ